METLGFIGLGTMGRAMAGRLLAGGYRLRVWNRSVSATESLVASGATLALDPIEVMSSGVVFSMLANDEAAESIFTAEVLAKAPEGTIHVNHSTISVAATDRLAALHAAADVAYVAAPVLGKSNVAEAGRLNIVVGGAPDDITRVQPFLDVMGKQTWLVGDSPAKASLVKIGVNYNLIHTLQALAESVTLMEHGGVNGMTFIDLLTDAAYTGSAYSGYGDLIARRAYSPPGFTVALGLKDLSLAEQAAASCGVVLSTAPVLRNIFEQAMADPELASLDWSAIAEVTRALSAPRHL